jgi:hypothetical protein
LCRACARATKVDVTAAVTITTNATPWSITTTPTSLPAALVGVTSP